MFGIDSAIITGLGSSLISGIGSLLGGKKANKQAQENAMLQMAFQERMANTAHQREVADLRMAGLNPILSATGGPGAPSPVGARAEVSDVVTPSINSALAARRNAADVDLLVETAKAKGQEVSANLPQVTKALTEQQRDTAQSQEALNSVGYNEAIARTDMFKAQTMTEQIRAKAEAERVIQIRNEAAAAGHSARLLERDADIGTGKYGEVMKYLQILRDVTGGFGGGFRRR